MSSLNATDIAAIAQHLFDTQGPKAIAEAARKATALEQSGDHEQAKIWQRVEQVLREMRGPRQT